MATVLGSARFHRGDTRSASHVLSVSRRLGDVTAMQPSGGQAVPRGGEALMPEEHDERADFGEPDDFTEADEFDDLNDLDDDKPGDAGRAWPAPGYPPGGYPDPPGGWRRGGGDRLRRG